MINIKELRPGNWIFAPNSLGTAAVACIDSVEGPHIFVRIGEHYYRVSQQEIDGIPLTDQLMTKLGFVLFDEGSGVRTWKMTFHPGDEYMCVVKGGEYREDGEFKYLHELQNAFENSNETPLPVRDVF